MFAMIQWDLKWYRVLQTAPPTMTIFWYELEVIVGMNARYKNNFVYNLSNITASHNLLARPIRATAHQKVAAGL